jgi:ornithine decarboxylase
LLKRTGFQLPVFIFSQEPTDVPDGATAVIGKAQEFLELETAASRYEENLLPPFFDTLSQYVEMGNSTFACPGTSTARFSKTPGGRQFLISSVRTFFAPICAMPT